MDVGPVILNAWELTHSDAVEIVTNVYVIYLRISDDVGYEELVKETHVVAWSIKDCSVKLT